LLALLPLVLLAASREVSAAWSICQALLGAWLLFLFVWTQRQQKLKGVRPRRPFVNGAMWALGIAMGLLNLVVAGVAIGPSSRVLIYLIALLWLLLAAMLQFVIQIMSSLGIGDSD
jgi:hypothetical protein